MKEIDKLCLIASGIFFAKTEDAAQAQVDKLRTALEQAMAVKPVGYWLVGTTVVEFDQQDYHSGPEWEPIYTAPPARVDGCPYCKRTDGNMCDWCPSMPPAPQPTKD